jgi:hypothetical protein
VQFTASKIKVTIENMKKKIVNNKVVIVFCGINAK